MNKKNNSLDNGEVTHKIKEKDILEIEGSSFYNQLVFLFDTIYFNTPKDDMEHPLLELYLSRIQFGMFDLMKQEDLELMAKLLASVYGEESYIKLEEKLSKVPYESYDSELMEKYRKFQSQLISALGEMLLKIKPQHRKIIFEELRFEEAEFGKKYGEEAKMIERIELGFYAGEDMEEELRLEKEEDEMINRTIHRVQLEARGQLSFPFFVKSEVANDLG